MTPRLRRRGRGQGGSQTLELVAALPLLALVAGILWQILVVLQAKAEAQADARVMARRAAICSPNRLPDPLEFDPDYRAPLGDGWRFDPSVPQSQTGPVTVVFTIHVPDLLGLHLPWVGPQEARATMEHEPCTGPTS